LAYAVVSPRKFELIEKKFVLRDHTAILAPHAGPIIPAVKQLRVSHRLHFTEIVFRDIEHKGEVWIPQFTPEMPLSSA
jgi:hypothetical protein